MQDIYRFLNTTLQAGDKRKKNVEKGKKATVKIKKNHSNN